MKRALQCAFLGVLTSLTAAMASGCCTGGCSMTPPATDTALRATRSIEIAPAVVAAQH